MPKWGPIPRSFWMRFRNQQRCQEEGTSDEKEESVVVFISGSVCDWCMCFYHITVILLLVSLFYQSESVWGITAICFLMKFFAPLW